MTAAKVIFAKNTGNECNPSDPSLIEVKGIANKNKHVSQYSARDLYRAKKEMITMTIYVKSMLALQRKKIFFIFIFIILYYNFLYNY